MSIEKTRWTRVAAVALVAATTVLPAVSAEAKAGDVIRSGSCSGRANWKIKASPQNGRIEVEGEVDSSRAGQQWAWSIRHNGSLSARGSKTTSGASGSFSIRRVVVNIRGTDRIDWRGRNPRSGEVCDGTLFF